MLKVEKMTFSNMLKISEILMNWLLHEKLGRLSRGLKIKRYSVLSWNLMVDI